MIQSAARKPEPDQPAVSAANDAARPAYERVLAPFEERSDGEPFEPEQVRTLLQLQRASRDHYATILNGLLEGRSGDTLPLTVVRGAQMLHRRIANALAQAALRLVHRPQLRAEQLQCAQLALCSLQARAEEIKWHAFEQTALPPASWEQANRLLAAVESLGLEREPTAEGSHCIDAFAHCLLLATLNVGILTPPQMELAQRWLVAAARDMRVEPYFDSEVHWYRVDLAAGKGPERVSPGATVADTTRFLAVAPLGPMLARARSQLYSGRLSVGTTPNRLVALHFGSFLDLAEKLWSQDFRRATWRSERENAEGETIEVVLGLDQVMALLDTTDDDPARPTVSSWRLRDRSATGLGATLPHEAGEHIALGGLMAFRESGASRWQLGCVVRRIRVPDASAWIVGIKRLSEAPLLVDLEGFVEGVQLEAAGDPEAAAIYAPITIDGSRIDGFVIDLNRFSGNNEFKLPTGSGAYHIRANRVMDRGDRWIRIGFEVLGKS